MLYTTLFWIAVSGWLYLLSLLKRAQLPGFYFIVGSVGLFSGLLFCGQGHLVWLFSTVLTRIAATIGTLFHCFSQAGYTTLLLKHSTQTIYLYLDFECSGVLETAAFVGLISFYPRYSPNERLFLLLSGALYIFLANLLRILLIAGVLYYKGSSWFYFIHSLVGRLIFYLLVIALYYNVFTRSHIIQKFLPYSRLN